ncbi:uncharacterized protein FMAN_13144 [Fusarium mangiferae]|uniref:Hemerythrin-like domain-containing protein n=1 Tax=Fusarium mangiferae TaxID=192010 RepID=A0A1L7TDF9_FUSMA|nr:uncharacterized protein FMAN_13144 [Fusarium mangiferae]CVK94822.1 uncharacterized protein FMAN_13144 [Fusarium mangiferae]
MGTNLAKPGEIPGAKELPPLSKDEFDVCNRLAMRMDRFHDHFRYMWEMLYLAADTQQRPSNLSLKQFIDTGIRFIDNLEGHHGIEERYIFPILAKKMPEFRSNTRNQAAAELLQQHEEIHSGITAMRQYLKACRSGNIEFRFGVLRSKMEPWGKTLLKHLDQEVKTLGAESMRRYWTLEEMDEFPF